MVEKLKIRYDKNEDRDFDVKKHDNPHHPSKHSHDKSLAEAEEKEKETDQKTDLES